MMDFVRRIYRSVENFCTSVVQWRSVFTILYVIVINFTFCTVAFYASVETQLHFLYGIIGLIVFTDLLLSSTRDHSVFYEIVTWPVKDFFKTCSTALCSLAAYELQNAEKEEAFVSSAVAVLCLIVDPVYKYHNVNGKILSFFRRLGSAFHEFLINWLVQPGLAVYEWLKYLVLFQWVPVLLSYLRNRWHAVYARLDSAILQSFRSAGQRFMDTVRYWIYFRWLTDLRALTKRVIYDPMLDRLTRLLDATVYVLGCYWMVPVLKNMGRQMANAGRYGLHLLKELSVAFGVYVVAPALAVAWAHCRVLFGHLYDAALQPVVDVCYVKYKFVEDMTIIYVLGPFFKRIVEMAPERNPFTSDNSDAELAEYIPKSARMNEEMDGENDDGLGGDESDALSSRSLGSLSNDERDFVPRGLNQVDISCSDSSEDEFSLFSRKRCPGGRGGSGDVGRQRRKPATTTTSLKQLR